VQAIREAKMQHVPVLLEQTGLMISPTSWQTCHKKLWRFLNHPVPTTKPAANHQSYPT